MQKIQRPSHGITYAVLFLAILLIFCFAAPVISLIPLFSIAAVAPAPSASSCIHFSVDDTIDLFHDLTVNETVYDSIFDQPDLAFFKQLHDQYGISVTFYCFYSWDTESNTFNLSDATDAFASEFTENADWLRFGFHAWDAPAYEKLTPENETEWYTETVDQLIRITGSENCIDHFLRLDRYTADEETLQALYSLPNGITGVLCPDPGSESQAYDLSSDEMKFLEQNDWYTDETGKNYTLTDLRFEAITSIADFYGQLNTIAGQERIVVFTHAWFIQDPDIQRYMSWLAQYGQAANYQFDFVHLS